ncbi:LysR family transcriptional regulator [Ornithinibacillus scapharcae]|uniref:LysR family transcriptional regulator n=1 Tax=Ornithinibacillus scapharcae TaxID=1147159 RepID=UPI000225BE22|nr:LysR family transcriptional regulator [Ornithinibacillus scapharcae]
MDLEQLRTFVSLASSKNFTRTAEEMNVVQSTITARIKLLEEEIGEELFTRKTRHVEITNAGTAFLPYAIRTLEIMSDGIKTVRIQSKFSNNLVIGGMNSLWETPILDRIHTYQTTNANTSFRLITGHSKDIVEKIQYGLIDVGFVYTPPTSAYFKVYKVREERIVLVGEPRLVNELASVNSKNLRANPFIHYNWGNEFSDWFEMEVGKHETMRYRVDDVGVALRLLLKGEGIGFMLASIKDKYERDGLISKVSFTPTTEVPKRSVYMVTSSRKEEKIEDFLNFMKG